MIAVSRVRLDGAICLALLVATLTAFWPVGQCDFINYDDPLYVVKNKEVQAGITSEGIRWAFTTGEGGNWHPLTWLSHMLTCQLFGLNAGAHHWVNLGFHAASVLLLFLTLRLMTGAVWRSAFVAALFALHPLRVESVAWISERKDVLSGFFTMLTLWAYARYAQRQNLPRYLLALFFFALGLMSKPMLVTLPLVLLLLDFWPLNRFTIYDSRFTIWKLIREKWPFFALALAAGMATFSFHHEAEFIQEDLPLEKRIPNAIVSCATYLVKMFWPKNLSVFYPYHEIPGWQTLGAALLLLGAFVLSIRKAGTRPYLLTGWFWFCVMLLPVIGIVQVGWQSMADRYTYLPSIGLFLVVAWGLADALPPSRPFRTGMTLGAIVLLAACIAGTRFQLNYWQNSTTLFSRALEVTPRNAVAHNNLGYALDESGNKKDAADHYRAAIEILPGYPSAHNNLGSVLIAQGKYQQAETHLRTALEIRPDYAIARVNLGCALALQGKNVEAQACFVEALQRDPRNASLHRNLATVLSARGNVSEASSEYSVALQLDPGDAAAREGLASLLFRQGEIDKALAQLDEVLNRQPTAEAHVLVAAIRTKQGDLQGAVRHYQEALILKPDSLAIMNNLAWVLATSRDASVRDGAQAISLAQKACEQSKFKRPVMVGTLAAAYAEAGRFAEAVATAEKACALASESGVPALIQKNRELLELYRAGRPYHEPTETNQTERATTGTNPDHDATQQ